MGILKFLRRKFMRIKKTRYGKQAFILSLQPGDRCLDVGCGNDSAFYHKSISPKTKYVGVDISEYNTHSKSKDLMNEYYIVEDPEQFAEGIRNIPGDFDAVISSHNIEHCNKPLETLVSICEKLKIGGKLFLAYPSPNTVDFPSRKGTLNFYDDSTHIWLPDTDEILRILNKCGMRICFKSIGYKPLYYRIMGGYLNLIVA